MFKNLSAINSIKKELVKDIKIFLKKAKKKKATIWL